MESVLTSFYSLAGHFGPIGSFFLLVGLFVERAFDRGWLKFGSSEEGRSERSKMTTLMNEILDNQKFLRLHFNDETTEYLENISNTQKQGITFLESNTMAIREGFREVSDKFKEYDKYGIKANCESKQVPA